MDKTLLLLLIMSGLLVAVFAPHATLTLTAVIASSIFTTRVIWSVVQSFEQTQQRQAID